MSMLIFDGSTHQLSLCDNNNAVLNSWHANNVVDSHATLRFVPNGSYQIIDKDKPHTHSKNEDSVNGPYGSYGIIRIHSFKVSDVTHDGVGVHAGRANHGGADHATMGCIRTIEEAMKAISEHMDEDPLTTLTVQGNHDQHKKIAHQTGDQH